MLNSQNNQILPEIVLIESRFKRYRYKGVTLTNSILKFEYSRWFIALFGKQSTLQATCGCHSARLTNAIGFGLRRRNA